MDCFIFLITNSGSPLQIRKLVQMCEIAPPSGSLGKSLSDWYELQEQFVHRSEALEETTSHQGYTQTKQAA